ncbi:YhdP family protein [Aquabacterium sp.]|uniref:YhdP family protein n=1 Tax=Aquabacterium sp. TaxID=1872578 RepID=UPI002487271C|nr:YhdP family protein [Aquabacterium sp.]MDI1259319.1 YhdP family protein [Aquabacterium sp.]
MPTISSDSSGHAKVSKARSLLRVGRWCLLTLAVLLFMAAIAWWALLFQILPRIGSWREALAQQATKALGVPVRIGALSGLAEGWSPVLSLKDVALLDERGSVALRLPEVTARISPSTLWPTVLWRQEVRLDRLVLVRPELQVRRDLAGDLHVAGLKLASKAMPAGNGQVLDWVLSQRLIRIEQGAVRWTDELRQAPTLLLQKVDLDLSSHPGLGTQVHHLSLLATPLPEFGQRFEVKARMTQPLWTLSAQEAASTKALELPWWRRWLGDAPKATDLSTWSGKLSVNLPHADVQSLRKHVDLPVDVEGGRGRMAAELVLKQGRPSSLALDLNVQDVSIRLEKGLQPLAFRALSGRIMARNERTESHVALKKLAFTTTEGLVWPASSAQLAWRHAPLQGQINANVWRQTVGGQVDADRLDLGVLARLADRLPISTAMRRTLADLAPEGVGRQLTWRWQGPADDPREYSARAQIKGFGWAASAKQGRPGLAEADIDLKADEHGGQASVAIQKGWVELPGAFDEPRIPLSAMAARVNWRIKPADQAALPPQLQVEVKKATFANDDAEGELQATWQTGPGTGTGTQARFPGHLDLEGKLAWGQANRVWRYLPSVIPFHARDYVRMAVREGRGEKVTFEVKGALAGFPFKDDQGGRFRVHVPTKNVTLDYVPAALLEAGGVPTQTRWPAFTGLDGDLIFEGLRLRIQGAKAQLGGLGTGSFLLRDVEGRIENLASDDPHLEIRGQGQGPLNDLLRYMAVSPVGVWTGKLLHKAEGTGTGSLQLALDIPLNHTANTGLRGRVRLVEQDQAALRLHPSVPLLQKVRGQVDFTQKTLKVSAVANVWGQDVTVEGQQDASGAPKFVAQGLITAEGLRTASEWPALAQLAQRMTGQAAVTVTVALPKVAVDQASTAAQPELHVVSTLQGLAVDLPAPLNKSAESIWPLTMIHRSDDPSGLSDALLVELGAAQSANAAGSPWLRADFRRDVKGDQAKVTRGALSLVQSTAGGGAIAVPALPPKGVVAQVTVPTLDLDAWQGLARVVRSPSSDSVGPGEDYLPDTLSLRAGVLNYQQRNLRNVDVTLAHPNPGVWRAQIESDQLAGQIEMRPETSPLASGPTGNRIVARLSRLSVPAAEAEAFEDQAALQLLTPETVTVPALDIVIDELDWRGLPLGKMEVEALNRLVPAEGGGVQPEWRLNKLRMTNPEAQLNASGNWMAVGLVPGAKPQQKAAFNFTLELNNSGSLLGRLGLPQTLKGGKGRLTGQIAWMGSPLEPNPATMTGELSVDIKEGQFLKVDPGMAKLLGVLSLQSLPRRLVLDFRDVFQQGFAFDAIDGDVSIKQGVADTRNLRMRGVQAVVMMEGQADLARETQNLHVFVVPEVNAGTASLAYAVINPAVGLGTFIAQVLLRKQVAEASTRQFSITGSWADPQVERVQRSLLAPVPAASQPAKPPAGLKGTKKPS